MITETRYLKMNKDIKTELITFIIISTYMLGWALAILINPINIGFFLLFGWIGFILFPIHNDSMRENNKK